MLDQGMVAALAEAAFGRWAMVIPDEDWIRASGITHEPTLGFLRTVGLPVESVFSCSVPELTDPPLSFRAMARAFARDGRGPSVNRAIVERYADLVCLGDGACDLPMCLDPRTGSVLSFVDFGAEPFLYNSSLAHLVYFNAYFETHLKADGVYLDELDDFDRAFELAEAIGLHLAEIDPEACRPAQDNLWQNLAIDGFASGLYEEWSWSPAGMEYFAARGLDPTRSRPRRPLYEYSPNPWA